MRVVRQVVNEPDPEGIAEGFSRIGYRIEEALADVIDNAIDARAHHVLVVFERDDARVQTICIVDDGEGIRGPDLDRAMQFGARTAHSPGDLGRYGWGFKTASLSQGRRLALLTRSSGDVAGRQWTRDSIDAGWLCDELHPDDVAAELDRGWPGLELSRHGTLLEWSDLDHLSLPSGDIEPAIGRLVQRISTHLGMVFHRYLAGTVPRHPPVEIGFATRDIASGSFGVVRPVLPLDPFGYPKSGAAGFPRDFVMNLPDAPPLVLSAHIWPSKSKDEGYRLGGGRVAERQGFFFYRNDRLIQAGGWNGWRQANAEPHFSLARVAIELPVEFDTLFRLQVQKSGLDVPPSFLAALAVVRSQGTNFEQYVQAAERTYRTGAKTAVAENVLVPGAGFPRRLQDRVRRGAKKAQTVDFVWEALADDHLFEVDRDEGTVRLNARYRSQLNGGRRGSSTDIPVFKTLLLRLLERDLTAARSSRQRSSEIEELNALLLLALEHERAE